MIFIPILVIFVLIALYIVVANVGKICLFSTCFYIISPQFSSELSFWGLLLVWIVVQVLFIYIYIKIGFLVSKGFKFSRDRFGRFLEYVRRVFNN
jgi:hypothetical protein